jgi:hypothetical protein
MRELQLYDMTEFSIPAIGSHGDCFRACVKTLFQISVDLPHPVSESGDWNTKFLRALEKRKLFLSGRRWRDSEDHNYLPRVVIASGPTKRTPDTQANHAVIWDRAAKRMIHDPHPSREGLLSIEWLYYFERDDK